MAGERASIARRASTRSIPAADSCSSCSCQAARSSAFRSARLNGARLALPSTRRCAPRAVRAPRRCRNSSPSLRETRSPGIRPSWRRSSTVRSPPRLPTTERPRADCTSRRRGSRSSSRTARRRTTPFTRAQSDLAGNLGLAAAAGGMLVGYAATGNADKGVRAIALGSAIAGTAMGVALGQRLSDAEAHAATLGIETAAATAVTVAGVAGADQRSMALAAALAGARGVSDWRRLSASGIVHRHRGRRRGRGHRGLVGVLAGGAVVASIDHPSPAQYAGFLGGGYLAGVALGDLAIARRIRPHPGAGERDQVGALAGGLLGLAVPVLSGAEDNGVPYAVAPAVPSSEWRRSRAPSQRSGRRSRRRAGNGARLSGDGSGLRFSITPGGLGRTRRQNAGSPRARATRVLIPTPPVSAS